MDNTPLYHAVKGQHLDAVKLLLEHNANPDMDTLSLAYSDAENIEITDLLIRYGAKVDRIIVRTILDKHISLIHTMIECGISMTCRHLYYAFECGIDMYTIKLLLNTGIEVNDPDYPAIHASYNIEHTELLVSYGADINATLGGTTVLYRYIWRHEHDIIDRLLHVPGIDVDLGDIWTNETPLMTALKRHKTEIAHVLLNHGADPHIQTETDRISPLYYAVQTSDPSMINRLLGLGVSPNNDTSYVNEPPLIYALHKCKTEIAYVLLDHGADPHIQTEKDKISPLHRAVQTSDLSIINRLLELGVSPSICDNDGNQPLHYANNIHAIEALIDTGKVDINAKNKKSMTPIYNAYDVNCAALLVQHGAILDTMESMDIHHVNIYRHIDDTLNLAYI